MSFVMSRDESHRDVDSYFLALAALTALRSTCGRRKTGAVITTADNYILGVGFNGVPRGFPHCVDVPCPAVHAASGTALDGCYAVHAEMNALLQCKEPDKAAKLYVTVSPCIHCMKVIANTAIKQIICCEAYPHEIGGLLDAANCRLTILKPARIQLF